MELRFEERFRTGPATLDLAIGDLAVLRVAEGAILYATTGPGGGVSGHALQADAAPVPVNSFTFTETLGLGRVGRLEPVTTDGALRLVLGGGAEGLFSLGVQDDGGIGTLTQSGPLAAGAQRLVALAQIGGPAAPHLVLADAEAGLALYSGAADGALTAQDRIGMQAAEIAVARPGDAPILLAADAAVPGLVSYRIDIAAGRLIEQDRLGAADGLGIAAPNVMEVVEAHGATWALLGAADSQSLSVMRVLPGGGLEATEHLIDTRETRFGGIQDLAVARAGDRLFVVAGGADDGLALFTLLPDGRLVHLHSLPHDTGRGLADIAALAAAVVGPELQVFAAGQDVPGLSRLSVPIGDLGAVRHGTGTLDGTGGDDLIAADAGAARLSGGAGDDILVAAARDTILTGGDGADLFVLRAANGAAGAPVRITDFEPGLDRLDLSDFPMLRNPGQLSVTATDTGAVIAYFDEGLVLDARAGTPLEHADIFGARFTWPDRALHFTVSGGEAAYGGTPDPAPDTSGDTSGTVPDTTDPAPEATGGTLVAVVSGQANPGLENAHLTLTPAGGAPRHLTADAEGRFNADLDPGATGRLDITRAPAAPNTAITARDALEALRLGVGLAPTWGPADAFDFIAADINRDGQVTAGDALEVLRIAVGLNDGATAGWIYLDPAADLSGIGAGAVDYQTGIGFNAPDGTLDLTMTALLLGQLDGPA